MTTGQNILHQFENRKKDTPFRFQTRGKGLDRRGEPVTNDLTLLSVDSVNSNLGWSLVKVLFNGNPLHIRLYHNQRYTVPVEGQ
jgi:hypothetical protein